MRDVGDGPIRAHPLPPVFPICRAIAQAQQQITVNAIVPGLVGTERREDWAESMARQAGKAKAQWLHEFCLSKGIFSGSWVHVEEVGDMATFVASDRGRYLNGAKLALDGGLTVNVR